MCSSIIFVVNSGPENRPYWGGTSKKEGVRVAGGVNVMITTIRSAGLTWQGTKKVVGGK